MSDPTFVSCNGLAGFMDYGFIEEGFRMLHRTGTLDFGNRMADANRHLLGEEWDFNFTNDPLDWHVPGEKVDVVMGLPPCSGWSCWSGPANRGPDAKAHAHTRAFMTYAGRVTPDAAVFECVGQAFTQGREVMVKYREMVEEVSGVRYDLHHVRMNNLQVGGKSFRPRYFWVAVREGIPFDTDVEWPEGVPTLLDTIGDLADLDDTWDSQPYQVEHSPWVSTQVSQSGKVDGHKQLDNTHNKRVKEMFDYLEQAGDEWHWGEGLSIVLKRVFDHHEALPPSWQNKGQKLIERNFDMGFSIPYRWPGNSWANVLTGGALDMVVHPTRPRTITHREAARIQGLPDDWQIKPVRDYGAMRDAWGKAVSVDAGRWIAKQVKAALFGEAGSNRGEPIGDREWLHHTDKGFTRQSARNRYFPGTKGGITKLYDPTRWPSKLEDAEDVTECEVA